MQSKQTIARLLIVVIVVAVGFHSTAYALKGYSAMSESEDFRSASETKVFKHTIAAPWTAARLKVAMRVEKGEATLRLVDEKGATRWEKTFEKGQGAIDETFPGQGKWRVELRLRDASGSYEIRLIGV